MSFYAILDNSGACCACDVTYRGEGMAYMARSNRIVLEIALSTSNIRHRSIRFLIAS